MHRFSLALLAVLTATALAAAPAVAQPRRAPTRPAAAQKGTIEGDVYLVMQSGDIQKAAANTVYLLRLSDSLPTPEGKHCDIQVTPGLKRIRLQAAETNAKLLSVFTPGTPAYQNHLQSLADRKATLDAITARLSQHAIAEAGTGMNAHYKFTGVRPGEYVLWAETQIGDQPYQWWTRVSVKPGAVVSRDLDNSVEVNGGLYCGWR